MQRETGKWESDYYTETKQLILQLILSPAPYPFPPIGLGGPGTWQHNIRKGLCQAHRGGRSPHLGLSIGGCPARSHGEVSVALLLGRSAQRQRAAGDTTDQPLWHMSGLNINSSHPPALAGILIKAGDHPTSSPSTDTHPIRYHQLIVSAPSAPLLHLFQTLHLFLGLVGIH